MKVFIDTNVIKFSATKQLRLIPANKPTRNWYGKITGYQVSTLEYINPNDRLNDGSEIRSEVALLQDVADLAKNGHIVLLEEMEMMVESMGLPNIGSSSGRFYNAPIQQAIPPIKYERLIIGPRYMGFPDASELTLNFLKGIDVKRFKDIQKLTGAFQGGDKFNLNQLIDAFLIWSAEHNDADFFLTLDFKLINMVKRDKKHNINVKLVRPSELLEMVASDRNKK